MSLNAERETSVLPATKFIAACCRWPHTLASETAVVLAANATTDWQEIRQAATRHRVIPLVHQAIKDLEEVPTEFREWAKQRAQALAFHSMQMTNEAIKIDRAFKDAGLRPLHFKGPVLAQIAFGSVALKYSHDLDIFVSESGARTAIAILEGKGYFPLGQDRPLSKRQIDALILNSKDMGFVGPAGILIEIHWRLTTINSLLNGLENNLHRQAVTVAGSVSFDTFGTEQMLVYLVFHGAVHHWKRLKWLADISAFLEQIPANEREKIIAKVQEGPAADALAQALHLCDTLFETSYRPHLSRNAQKLSEYSLTRIDEDEIVAKRPLAKLGFFTEVIPRRHLYPSVWAAIWAFKSHLICQGDVLAVPLPRYLNGIYPIIRLPSFLLRRLRGSRQVRAPDTR